MQLTKKRIRFFLQFFFKSVLLLTSDKNRHFIWTFLHLLILIIRFVALPCNQSIFLVCGILIISPELFYRCFINQSSRNSLPGFTMSGNVVSVPDDIQLIDVEGSADQAKQQVREATPQFGSLSLGSEIILVEWFVHKVS